MKAYGCTSTSARVTLEFKIVSFSLKMIKGLRLSYLVDEGRLADVGEPGDDDGPGVGVDGRQTAQMLTDLKKSHCRSKGPKQLCNSNYTSSR